MRRSGWNAFLLIFLALASVSFAHAEKRVALIVGNSAYHHTPKLANPRNDAADISVVLKKHGFQVIEGFDLDKVSLERKVRDFAGALQGAAVGLFFYAGHGLQVGGQNYLVPIDAQLTTADALEFEMVRVDMVHRIMERVTSTNVLFLDACRDNPLLRNLARAMGTRSADIGRGLAAVESGIGTLISFSTQPGNVALDGAGRNSPFAAALVKHISASTDDLSAILIAVRNDVMKETQRKQVPWEHSALTGKFYFSGPRSEATSITPTTRNDAADAWAVAKDSTDPTVLEAFVRRYGETFYGDLARARIEDLKKQKAAAARPPPPPTGAQPQARELARAESEGLLAIVRQATKTKDQIALVVDITNTGRKRIGLAVEQYPLGNAGTLLGDDGTSCSNPRLQGLVPLWVYGNYDAGVEDRQQTLIGAQASVTAVISFAARDCKGAKRLKTGLLTLPLFFISERAINKRSSLVIPSIQLGEP